MKKLFAILASSIIPFTGIIGSTGFAQVKTVTPQKATADLYNHFVFHHSSQYEIWFDLYMTKSDYNGYKNFFNNFGGYHVGAFRYLLQYWNDGDYKHNGDTGMPYLGDGPWHWFVNWNDRIDLHMPHFGSGFDSRADVAFYISSYAGPKEGWDAWMAKLTKTVIKYWWYNGFVGIKFSFEWTWEKLTAYQFVEGNYKMLFDS